MFGGCVTATRGGSDLTLDNVNIVVEQTVNFASLTNRNPRGTGTIPTPLPARAGPGSIELSGWGITANWAGV